MKPPSTYILATEPFRSGQDPDVFGEFEYETDRVPPARSECNPYLSFSALLMAGIDGIKKKTDPGKSFEGNTYELDGKAARKIPTVRGFPALEADHKFLLKGGVFTQDVIDVWIEYKRSDIDWVRLRPHSWEFHLYSICNFFY